MPPKSQSEQGVDARVAAAHLLARVTGQGETIDEALDKVGGKYRLSEDDRRLVHAISGIVFRKLPAIDAVLRTVMNRKRDPSPVLLHQLLRVGVAQLLWMGVAEHAAVNTCVAATGSLNLSRQKGLVNAVLRSVQRQKDDLLTGCGDALDMLPAWLRDRWVRQYGESRARSLAAAASVEAPIDLTIKDAQASLEMGQMLQGEVLLEGAVRVRERAGHITSWPGFQEGAWWVQDLASSLPVRVLGDVAGKSVLDMCAAPGGKTMQLAASGARVTALDISASRMKRVTENLRRVNLVDRVETVVHDSATWRTDTRFDVVLLDAPCSSTGTLRRHPELPWIHSENGVSKMAVVQRDLLRRAADLVAHDGILLYCTCSLEEAEGESQLDAFLTERKDFKQIRDIPSAVHPFLAAGARDLGFRAYPDLLADKGGMDGFFIAPLQKI